MAIIQHPNTYSEAKLTFFIGAILLIISFCSTIYLYNTYRPDIDSLDSFTGLPIFVLTHQGAPRSGGGSVRFMIEKEAFIYPQYNESLAKIIRNLSEVTVLAGRPYSRYSHRPVYQITSKGLVLVSFEQVLEIKFRSIYAGIVVVIFSIICVLYGHYWMKKLIEPAENST